MALVINTNTSSLNVMRNAKKNDWQLATSLQRLSSGVRVNSAADDAAGLAISDRFTTQIRALDVSFRNINSGISLAQTAEGALQEISNLLQRGRELGVQAENDSNSSSDKIALQEEIIQIKAEISRIAKSTEFNGVKVFSEGTAPDQYAQAKLEIVEGLKASWLEQSEALITSYLGISGDGVDITVVLDDTIAGASAYVQGSNFDGNGRAQTLELHVDVGEYVDNGMSWPDDSFDNLIAHEMVHAVMFRNADMQNMENWMSEGIAEFLPGGDNRLYGVLNNLVGEGPATSATLAAHIDSIRGAWTASHRDYATAYAATKYLEQRIVDAGITTLGIGVKDMLQYFSTNAGTGFDDYITANGAAFAAIGIANTQDFVDDFKANGAAFIDAMDLTDSTDVGGVGGAETGNLGRDTSYAGAIPDIYGYTENPLANFNTIFPILETPAAQTLDIQVGADEGDTIELELVGVSLTGLGLADVTVVGENSTAIGKFDLAIAKVADARANLGATMNRLEYSLRNNENYKENISASRSRVLDADYAVETAELTRSQILTQAATSMLAQANSMPQVVLSLLG